MLAGPIRHRRARHTDFDAVCAVLVASGLPATAREHGALRRFRRLVADLGADLYLAERGITVLGLVHITYARHLFCPPRARIELLVVAPPARGQSIGRGLAALAAARARRRGCAELRCSVAPGDDGARAFLARAGWRGSGEEFEFDLTDPAQ